MQLLQNLRNLINGNPSQPVAASIPVEMAPTVHEMEVVFNTVKNCILSSEDVGLPIINKMVALFGESNLQNVDMHIIWADGTTLSGQAAKDYKLESGNFPIKVTLGSSLANNG